MMKMGYVQDLELMPQDMLSGLKLLVTIQQL